MYISWSDRKLFKLLQVQLRQRNEYFSVRITGGLTKKQTQKADTVAQEIIAQLLSRVEKYKWQPIAKARVAVTFSFHTTDRHMPALHNLVKFYLDLLQNIVFENDRQVGYLTAECWRPTTLGDNPVDDAVYIKVERLSDCQKRFDLYFSLLEVEEFRDFLKEYVYDKNLLNEDRRRPFEDIFFTISPGTPDELRQQLQSLQLLQFQEHILSLNKIDALDRPGGLKKKKFHIEQSPSHVLRPFTVDLGNLPRKGEGQQYKQRVQERIKHLRESLTVIRRIEVPIEIDVRVIPRRGASPEKDLDNILRDIAPILQEELLGGNAYLQSYRVYVARNYSDTPIPNTGSIKIKLLAENSIHDFYDKMEQTFKLADDWLLHKLG